MAAYGLSPSSRSLGRHLANAAGTAHSLRITSRTKLMLELFRSKRRALLWMIEAFLIVSTLTVAELIRFGWSDFSDNAGPLLLKAMVASLIVQSSLYYHGLYADEPVRS